MLDLISWRLPQSPCSPNRFRYTPALVSAFSSFPVYTRTSYLRTSQKKRKKCRSILPYQETNWSGGHQSTIPQPKCLRKLLRISYLEHKTNDLVQSKINFLVGPQEPLLAAVKRWIFASFSCYASCQSLPNHSSGHLGGWAMMWLAEEMRDGQHQRVEIPCPCQNCS